MTADDVIFSFEVLQEEQPVDYASYYRHIMNAEKVGERDIRFTFDAPGNRELPAISG